MDNPYAPPPRGSDADRGIRPGAPGGSGGPAGPGRPGGPGDPGGGPGRPGFGRGGPRPKPDPETLAELQRQVMHASVALLGAWLAGSLPVPWYLLSPVLALAAVGLAVRVVRNAWRRGVRGAVVAVAAVMAGSALLLVLVSVSRLVVWSDQQELQDCLRDALTISAREQCEREFTESLDERLREAARRGQPTVPAAPP